MTTYARDFLLWSEAHPVWSLIAVVVLVFYSLVCVRGPDPENEQNQ